MFEGELELHKSWSANGNWDYYFKKLIVSQEKANKEELSLPLQKKSLVSEEKANEEELSLQLQKSRPCEWYLCLPLQESRSC